MIYPQSWSRRRKELVALGLGPHYITYLRAQSDRIYDELAWKVMVNEMLRLQQAIQTSLPRKLKLGETYCHLCEKFVSISKLSEHNREHRDRIK